MADEDEEVVVVIDDVGGGAEPEKTAADTTIKVVEKPEGKDDDALTSLKSQFNVLKGTADAAQRERDAALRATAEANQRAEEARREVVEAKGQVVESQYDTVTSGIAGAEAEADAAQVKYKTAFDAGDGDGMAKAQREMARAESKLTRLQEAKADIEQQQTTRKTEVERAKTDETRQQEQRRAAPADPVEAYVANRTAPTAAWLRAHPDYVTDTKKNAKLTAAHYDAMSSDVPVDTPEYFAHVEKFIGIGDKATQQRTPSQRRPGAPTTPVSHAGGGMNGGGAEVRLTRGEANAATDGTLVWNYDDPSGQKRYKKGDVIGVQELARRKLALQKDGRYDRAYLES